MQKYKHLFFDLDHTLWDFDTNAQQTLSELYAKYEIEEYFGGFDNFFEAYQPINMELWDLYRCNKITKEYLNVERFYRPLKNAGFDQYDTAKAFANDFIALSPLKTNLLPHTIEMLDYLRPKYQMHIITNGFKDTQHTKLIQSGLRPYFKHVFISELIGANKPSRAFFEHAIKNTNARKRESLVIGDSLEADIVGARGYGLDHVYFNPSGKAHNEKVMMEIKSFYELMAVL